jgi:hypothetical protein
MRKPMDIKEMRFPLWDDDAFPEVPLEVWWSNFTGNTEYGMSVTHRLEHLQNMYVLAGYNKKSDCPSFNVIEQYIRNNIMNGEHND